MIEDFNVRWRGTDFEIMTNSIPEPYVGSFKSAKLILLLLNPGHSDDDLKWQRREDYRKDMINNHNHIHGDFPFYVLNPKYVASPAARWWLPKLKYLIAELGVSLVAQKVCAVQWYPYHSRRFKFHRHMLDLTSSKYTWQLCRGAILNNQAKVVIMRSKNLWDRVLNLPTNSLVIKNPRNPTISPRNLGQEEFNLVLNHLGK